MKAEASFRTEGNISLATGQLIGHELVIADDSPEAGDCKGCIGGQNQVAIYNCIVARHSLLTSG